MVKNIPFPFAFVFKNSYIAKAFETLTNNQWETELMVMQVKTVVNDDDYLFLLTPFLLLKTKIV